MPEQGLFQTQSLRQEQILAPIQLQSLEILMCNSLELQEKISQELSDNPVLEQEKADDLPEAEEADRSGDADGEKEGDEWSRDTEVERLVEMADMWQTRYTAQPRGDAGEEDEKRRHFFDSLVDEPSIQEQLLEQARLSGFDEKTAKLAEIIIGSVDDQGYLRSHLADLATLENCRVEEVEAALKKVQEFDPPGVAARDLKECLLLQLRRQGKGDSTAAAIVSKHLEDFARNRLPKIAEALDISMDELRAAIVQIRALNPFPCSVLAPDQPVFVTPEVIVEKRDGQYAVQTRDERLPRLRLSTKYLEMLERPDVPVETKNYIKEKISRGKNLIKSIEQRQDTLRRVAEVIVDTQYDFLENGIDFLKPLTMKQVADKIGVHETTVSRAISNKYIRVPSGLYEFKFFFTSGFQSSEGDLVSNRGVMEMIKEMIAGEDPMKPISDDYIAQELNKKGLSVARRTVAKYREDMGIPSSRLRREFA